MIEKLKHRNYKQVAEGNLEFIRGDIWDLEMGTADWPTAVYNPGIDTFLVRLKDVNISLPNSTGKIEKDIFAQHIIQNAGRDTQNGSLTLSFVDREDQAITFMANDWLNQVADPDTGFGRHKSELVFNCRINIYNTLLQKIRFYNCDTGILDSADIPDNPGDKGSDMSDVSLTLSFQQIKRLIL